MLCSARRNYSDTFQPIFSHRVLHLHYFQFSYFKLLGSCFHVKSDVWNYLLDSKIFSFALCLSHILIPAQTNNSSFVTWFAHHHHHYHFVSSLDPFFMIDLLGLFQKNEVFPIWFSVFLYLLSSLWKVITGKVCNSEVCVNLCECVQERGSLVHTYPLLIFCSFLLCTL